MADFNFSKFSESFNSTIKCVVDQTVNSITFPDDMPPEQKKKQQDDMRDQIEKKMKRDIVNPLKRALGDAFGLTPDESSDGGAPDPCTGTFHDELPSAKGIYYRSTKLENKKAKVYIDWEIFPGVKDYVVEYTKISGFSDFQSLYANNYYTGTGTTNTVVPKDPYNDLACAPPTDLKLKQNLLTRIIIEWNNSGDATSYEIEQSDNILFTNITKYLTQ